MLNKQKERQSVAEIQTLERKFDKMRWGDELSQNELFIKKDVKWILRTIEPLKHQ